MRRARRFQPAVHCPASFLPAPIRADLGMDPDEEASTAASFDQTAAVSGSCRPTLAASSTEWLEILPTQRLGRPITVKKKVGLPFVRFADSLEESSVVGGIVPRTTHPQPHLCAGAKGSIVTGARMHRSVRDGWVDRHVVRQEWGAKKKARESGKRGKRGERRAREGETEGERRERDREGKREGEREGGGGKRGKRGKRGKKGKREQKKKKLWSGLGPGLGGGSPCELR